MRRAKIALATIVVLVAGAAIPAAAAAKSDYVDCRPVNGIVAVLGVQTTPSDLLYLSAAGMDQVRINVYQYSIANPSANVGYGSASSQSLDTARSKGYCSPK